MNANIELVHISHPLIQQRGGYGLRAETYLESGPHDANENSHLRGTMGTSGAINTAP
jgi:hypothetical protein